MEKTTVKQRPWMTLALLAMCFAISMLVHVPTVYDNVIAGWIFVDSWSLWDGRIWGYFTNSLVHFELWHLGFNLYWFWHFGKAIEKASGPKRLLLLTGISSFFASGFQMLVSGETGVGLSGVGYALFGYLWANRKNVSAFGGLLSEKFVEGTRITVGGAFFGWLLVCVAITATNILSVANAAHFAGLLPLV